MWPRVEATENGGLRDGAGLYGLRLYDLRHTVITELAEMGGPATCSHRSAATWRALLDIRRAHVISPFFIVKDLQVSIAYYLESGRRYPPALALVRDETPEFRDGSELSRAVAAAGAPTLERAVAAKHRWPIL